MTSALISFLFTLQYGLAPQITQPVDSLRVSNIDYFTIDQYENIYMVSFNQLTKIDKNRKQVFTFSNPVVGTISSVSAFDPLKLILFYKDQSKVTILDNRLTESSETSFEDYGLLDVQLISQSDENNIWAFDQATDRLYRLNISNQKITNKSLNISQILKEESSPAQLESTIEKVYLNIPGNGILVFDATGSLNKTIPVKGIRHFAIGDEVIYYLRNKEVFYYDLETNKEKRLGIKVPDGRFVALSEKKLYVLGKRWLRTFRIP